MSGDALQYLERFLNSIKALPAEVATSYRKVRELDVKCAEQMAAIEAASQKHCAAISAKQRLKQQNPRGRKGKGAGAGAASPSHANTPTSPTPSPPLDGADGNGTKPAAAAAAAAAEEMDPAAAAAYDVEAVERAVAADQNEAVRLAEEKLRLTQLAYDTVDAVCRRLDANMKKFEQQLRKASSVDVTAEPVDRRRGRKRDRSAEADDAHQLHRKLAAEMREEIEKAAAAAAAGAGAAAAAVTDSSSAEPVYCTCKKVSFGEMVACDNPDCPIEWFHFACVGLETTPKGKWFCDDCKSAAKKQKVKK